MYHTIQSASISWQKRRQNSNGLCHTSHVSGATRPPPTLLWGRKCYPLPRQMGHQTNILCKAAVTVPYCLVLSHRNDHIYVRQLAASGHVSFNVWTMVTYQGLGPIHRVSQEALAPDDYINVVTEVMIPFLLDGPFPDGTFVLQQDPTPTYKSKAVRNHLDQLGIQRIAWPPKCEDLNPIRNAWGLLKERLCRRRLKDPSAENLWALIKKEWDKLREIPNLVSGFYGTLPARMNEVVAARGGIVGKDYGDSGAAGLPSTKVNSAMTTDGDTVKDSGCSNNGATDLPSPKVNVSRVAKSDDIRNSDCSSNSSIGGDTVENSDYSNNDAAGLPSPEANELGLVEDGDTGVSDCSSSSTATATAAAAQQTCLQQS